MAETTKLTVQQKEILRCLDSAKTMRVIRPSAADEFLRGPGSQFLPREPDRLEDDLTSLSDRGFIRFGSSADWHISREGHEHLARMVGRTGSER